MFDASADVSFFYAPRKYFNTKIKPNFSSLYVNKLLFPKVNVQIYCTLKSAVAFGPSLRTYIRKIEWY